MCKAIYAIITAALLLGVGGCGGPKFRVQVDPNDYFGQSSVSQGTAVTVEVIQVDEAGRSRFGGVRPSTWFTPGNGDRQEAVDLSKQYGFKTFTFTKEADKGSVPAEFRTAALKSQSTFSSTPMPSYLIVFANAYDEGQPGRWRREIPLNAVNWPDKMVRVSLAHDGFRVGPWPK